MNDEATMALNEDDRDEGLSSEMIEAQRQAWAQQQFARNSAAGGLIGAPYIRPDGEVRAACLDAATRIGAEPDQVVNYARAFYDFLTEKPAA